MQLTIFFIIAYCGVITSSQQSKKSFQCQGHPILTCNFGSSSQDDNVSDHTRGGQNVSARLEVLAPKAKRYLFYKLAEIRNKLQVFACKQTTKVTLLKKTKYFILLLSQLLFFIPQLLQTKDKPKFLF